MQRPPLPWGLETDRHYIPALEGTGASEAVVPPLQGAFSSPAQPPYIDVPGLTGVEGVLALLAAAIVGLALAAVYMRLAAPSEHVAVVNAAGALGASSSRVPPLYRYQGERARVRRALDSAFKACSLPPSATPRTAGASKAVEGWRSAERVLYAESWLGGDVGEALSFAERLRESCRAGRRTA